MKFDKNLWMKIGIVAAIALIIYLVFRSRKCKDSYANWVPSSDDQAENLFENDTADYAEDADEYVGQEGMENFTLMESTLDDDHANAVFDPEY